MMKKSKTDFATYHEVLRTMPPEEYHTPAETDCRVTPNVGDIMAAAMAAAGTFAIVTGGRTACETDYLAASGAIFPATVTYQQMVAFNRETMKPVMEEADEMARYAAIARFFRRRDHAVQRP